MRRSTVRGTLAWMACGLALLAMLTTGSAAQDFPKRQPISIVVSYPAGGPSDVIARLIGEHMAKTLGQAIVIENVAGAAGLAGADRVAKAAPDGYTILIHHLALVSARSLYSNLRFDPATAFQPLGLVNTGPMVLSARTSVPATDAKSFFAWVKTEGEKVNMGHSGVGSNSYICAILLGRLAGGKPTLVAYRGAAPATNDLVAGKLDVLCDQSTNAVPQVQAGTVKAILVTAPERLSIMKDLPTAREVGAPEIEFGVWHGLYLPKGTPADVVKVLNDALRLALADVGIQQKFTDLGTTIYPVAQQSPEAHQAQFTADIARIAELLSSAGIKPIESK